MDKQIAIPFLGKIKIDFDRSKKAFFLTCPIFSVNGLLPRTVQEYVKAREGVCFHPYKTFYKLSSLKQVDLVQELPFQWGFQPSFREHIHAFRKIAAHCHHTLVEIAIEEKLTQIEEIYIETLF
jgi:hypothetical protein